MKRISNFSKVFGMICLVTLMVFTLAAGVSAAKFSKAEDSIVAVVSEYGTRYSTGVAIAQKGKDPGFILTSYDVLDSSDSKNAYVYFSFDAGKSVVATVHYSNPELGITVLRLPERTKEVVPCVFLSSKKVTTDTDLKGICYPNNLYTVDWLENSDDIIRPGIAINKLDRRNNYDVFEVSATSLDITDGCPVVNGNGEVVGLFVDTYKGHVVTSDEIMKALDDKDIAYAKAGADMAVLLIAIGAVLVVIVLVVVIIVVSSSKTMKKAPVQAPAASGQNMVNGYAPAGNPVQNVPAAMRLVCLGGALNGATFTVNGTSRIGRDASKCDIAYPVNTQGVSGCHCELTFDGTVCYLKDLQSSYGTFLANGTKLTPNVPQLLRSGDTFYLAGPENTFEVRF